MFLLRRWRGVMRVTPRCLCPPIVFRRGAPRTFQTRAVSSMCRRFRQDFCFGHRGLLSSSRRMGYCCRRCWTILVFRFLVSRSRTHDVSRFRGRIPHCHCRCMPCLLDPLLCRGSRLVQTVLASGTSSRPEVGSSAVTPPMDMEDCPLLETGLPGCPYRFTECSGKPFSDK